MVAIIGILAAVGTVAYTGYTANAKKSAAKSNHASVVKYIAAELQRCNMDETSSMDSNLTCADRDTAATVQAAAVLALSDFKNPFDTASAAVSTTSATIGFVKVKDSDEIIRGDGNSQNEREFLEGLKIMFGTLECRIGSIKTQKHLAYPDDKDGFEAFFLKKFVRKWYS